MMKVREGGRVVVRTPKIHVHTSIICIRVIICIRSQPLWM
jgi:hypothetical protein